MDQLTNNLSRRHFMKSGIGLGLIIGLSGMSVLSFADTVTPLKVVVVGGGFGGATASKYLKLWGKTAVDVTMIEPKELFMSPIMSGMVVTSQLEVDRISFSYDRLRDIHKVNVLQDSVTAVDSAAKTVTLSDGTTTVPYDRLILSPGIDFVDVEGWDREKLPHAWDGSEQTMLLQKQLACFPEGGTLIFNVPSYPFRCPPGPYERASAVADYLRVNKKNAKIIILDTQTDIFVENELFHGIYDDLGVEYIGNTRILSVNSGDDEGKGRSITYVNIEREERVLPTNPFPKEIEGSASEPVTIEADVINLIPDNKAAPLIFSAGLVPEGALWAPVNELTYESRLVPGIYILGDSLYTMQSKAGQMANAQAKVCADAILKEVAGQAVYQHPVTTAGGFAPTVGGKVNWIGVSYVYDPTFNMGPNTPPGAMVRKTFRSAPEPTEANREQMIKWANNLFADTWG